MLDRHLRPLIDPTLNRLGRSLAGRGITADALTLAGLALGIAASTAVVVGAFGMALGLLLASRLADGLDGAVARASRTTDFGGYLDITCDFLFYGLFPLAFVLHDPLANGVAGAILLTSFYANGASFLGYAILAERRGLQSSARGVKSLYFTGGLLEGTETILFFVLLCLWPAGFGPVALIFAGLCFLTALSRVLLARQVFRG
ncbi:CDP-alcohol phosphatidyltransferase family protein [Plastorhodobacter daqingensis]|uniref:CDP-alcohol phosphatidyltransferase family protein n=1 Tax=Plastorhodobacter daqingensis TaxID=1387281 RepID=A0ABW2UME3_9RHOB